MAIDGSSSDTPPAAFHLIDLGPVAKLTAAYLQEKSASDEAVARAKAVILNARKALAEAGVRAPEVGGLTVANASAATRQASELVEALQSASLVRTRAAETLPKIQAAADAAISDAQDVLTARRFIFILIIVASGLYVWGMF